MAKLAQKNLSGRAKRGGMWVLVGKILESGLRLVSNITLAWLLFPEAFGILVPVNVFLAGIQLFSDFGIGPSIVRSKRGEDSTFLHTVWTVQVLRGFLLYAVCWALAEPYARLIGEPIYDLLLVAGLSALFLGFRSAHWFTLDRRIAQGRKTLIQVLSQCISVVTMIILAWILRSPLAMVIGGVTGAFCQTLFSHLLLPGLRMRFRFEKAALLELYGFGRWIFLSTAIFFLASQVDRILVSELLEPGPRGLYRIALEIATLMPGVLSAISAMVIFPTWMESYRNTDGHHSERVQRSRRALLALGISGLIGIITITPFFFEVLYDERYQGAAAIAQLLCIPFWFETLMASATSALLVHGDSRALSGSNFLVLLVKAPACWLGFLWFGLEGFILGIAVGNIAGLLRLHLRLHSHGTRLLMQDVRATLVLLFFGGTGFLIAGYSRTIALVPGLLLAGTTAVVLASITIRPAFALLFRRQQSA